MAKHAYVPQLVRAGALLAVALLLQACSGMGKIDWQKLVTQGRDGWQLPDQVVAAVRPTPGDVVADIGAGKGYFLPWFSVAVGPSGKVYAVEVDEQLVRDLRARVETEGLSNVEVIHGTFDDPGLPDGTVDLVLTCNTYHHIEDRAAYFARLRTDLKPGGRVVHIDPRDNMTGILRLFLTTEHWTNIEAMRTEMASAGYQRVQGYDFLPVQNFEVFVPKPVSH
jgi:arsenite methyltransferase